MLCITVEILEAVRDWSLITWRGRGYILKGRGGANSFHSLKGGGGGKKFYLGGGGGKKFRTRDFLIL